MNKSEIKKEYILKIKEYSKHNKLYFEKNKPIITDAKFDQLKKEILNLENKYKFLKIKSSAVSSVGYKPSKSFEKYTHKTPMLSLSNAFDVSDLNNFEKKIFNFLNKRFQINYSVEPKIDGISYIAFRSRFKI